MSYEHGKITDEGIAKIKANIGHTFTGRKPWRTEVSRDAIWHLAHAIGDLSPLYTDEEYAAKTRWGKLVCPGIIFNTMDILRAPGSAGLPEGLPGVHSIWSGSHYEWERPLMIGDRVRSECYMKEVVERESRMSDGRTIYQTYEAKYWEANTGEYLGLRNDTYMRVDRVKAKEKSIYAKEGRLARWTPEDIDRFQAEYKRENRTAQRYWEDVKLGDDMGRLIKGPLTGTAEIAFEAFFGIYLVGNVVASRLLDKHPKLMIPNEQGVPEPPQRVHWDNKFTQDTLGLPGAYDLGLERCAWLCHLVTDWMGDDGMLVSIDARYRRFNYLGDVTWVRGKVVEKMTDPRGRKLVRCAVETVNHLDEVTGTADAIVALATRG
jgi:acyl dehydratase